MSRSSSRFAHWTSKHLPTIFIWLCGLILLFLGGSVLWAATLKIPDINTLETQKLATSLQIYDRTGTTLLYDVGGAARTVVPLSSISPNIQEAFVASEDPTFYQNSGIDIKSLLRAFLVDVTSLGAVQGGSTITQQVVKQSILTNNKTITRKLEEIILALKLTRAMSKDQILELYLNEVPMGGNRYGVETASEQYFGVPASAVTVPEAAYLAAVLPAPSYLSPYGNHRAELDARKNIVLDRMYEHGYISASERDAAKSAAVAFVPPSQGGIEAPHFVFYVEQYLEQKYGADAVSQSGWKVLTTLNADLQVHAEETVAKWAAINEKKFNASNAGLVAVDPTNGQILAMVGSRSYFDTKIDGSYNVALASRQPGSTFKPFAYAEAFEKGYTPDTVLFDLPTQFSTSCAPSDTRNDTAPCYAPVDYDNKWRGPMTMRNAIAQSINVPSVEVLYLAGVGDTLALARNMGITTLSSNPNQYGLTLVLGGGEVNLLQMTSAYGAFAQNGMRYPSTPILKVEDQAGNIVEDDSQPAGTQVVPAQIAGEINDILSDPVARAPLGEGAYFTFPGHDVAVKTGTTDNRRDAWTIGYTPNIAVGIWAGNNNNTPMTHEVSGFIVGPMWHEFMSYALTKAPDVPFQYAAANEAGLKPILRGIWQGGDPAIVDATTGLPATPETPPSNLQERVTCNMHSILYWLNKDDPNGPIPGESSTDPQFRYWEYPIQVWGETGGCQEGEPVIVGPVAPAAAAPQQQKVPSTTESTTSSVQ